MSWLSDVKSKGVPAVIQALNLKVGKSNSFGPCPACTELQRSSGDARLACGIARDSKGWRCHRCQAGGDPGDLISFVQYGRRTNELQGGESGSLRRWCVERGFCSESAPGGSSRPSTRTVESLLNAGRSQRRKKEKAKPEVPPSTPPSGGRLTSFSWREGAVERYREVLFLEEGRVVLDYLHGRGFTDETIREFGLGALVLMREGKPVQVYLVIPLNDESGNTVNLRFRTIPGSCLQCEGEGCRRCGGTGQVQQKPKYRVCPGRPLPLFNAERLSSDTDSVVIIAEGELDVMALHQYGFHSSVVSSSAGASTFKEEWLDVLEPYKSFNLVYDDDEAGSKGAASLGKKLGQDRTSKVKLPNGYDAADCLSNGTPSEVIRRCIEQAEPMFDVSLKRAGAYGDDLELLISQPDILKGRQTSSAHLNKCIGGVRPGLMIVSGDTGHGKTTWATWLCKDEADRGVPVLLTSFEQRPIGTVQKLLRMELGDDFTKVTKEERFEALGELSEKPIHILDHYGHLPIDQLMRTIQYSARRLGVKTVLVDHLGFLIDPDPSVDERRSIEAVIRALAITGYNAGVCIILICHPKNVKPGERVKMGDLKGASAIKQDASEVIIIERKKPEPQAKPPRNYPTSIVHVDKCRSEFGIAGSKCRLAFGPKSCVFADRWTQTPEGNTGSLMCVP